MVNPLTGETYTKQHLARVVEQVERVRQLCAERSSSSPSWKKRLARNPDFFKTFSPGGIR